MILRKPYAFLVKHFKLIHLALILVVAFLLYRTNAILSFLNEYARSNQTLVMENITNELFNIWMFVFPFLIIVLSLIIISVMYLKKKPILLYLYNIILAIVILVFYNIAYSMIAEMEAVLFEARSVRLFRDFVTILEMFQLISFITISIRATGFDIKKFNFKEDIAELDISETDNEEFEVNLEVDTNEMRRKFNYYKRFLKYIYYENKFIVDIGLLIGISIMCFVIYMNIGIYDRDVSQNTLFSTTSFYIGINDSYITNKGYKGKKITDDEMLVVLEMNIKSKGYEKVLDIATINLQIGESKFYHVANYKDDLMDLGHTYQGSMIPISFEKHLLVFKIPKSLGNEKMVLTYTDRIDYISNGINSKYIRVKIKPKKIDSDKKEISQMLGSELNLEESVLKKSKLTIQTIEIKKEFRENYNFCITKKECYPSAEIIHPNYNSNYEKAILKLKGTLELDSEIEISRIYSLYHFIYYFGSLKYEMNGDVITQKVTMNQIKPNKFNQKDVYYIEVAEEIMKADKIWLQFHIRNREYLYQLSKNTVKIK